MSAENMKPTKGPWNTPDGVEIHSIDGFYVASVLSWCKGVPFNEQTKANAALIAEAGTVYHETGRTPRQLAGEKAELLEALKNIMEGIGDGCECLDGETAEHCNYCQARAAIAKATARNVDNRHTD